MVRASQSLTDLSQLAAATALPSGEKAQQLTALVWPDTTSFFEPLCAEKNLSVSSPPAETAGLEPGNSILTVQGRMVRDARERAHPWFSVILSIAASGYDADPAKDPARYGASAAILQLLLQNRRKLRVPSEQYRHGRGKPRPGPRGVVRVDHRLTMDSRARARKIR